MNALFPQSSMKPAKAPRTWPKVKRGDSSTRAAMENLEDRQLFSAIAATIMPAFPLPKPFNPPPVAIIAILIG
jgi:hypothetical protein